MSAPTSRQIELAAQKAARLTHQLLAFARREVARPEVVDLNGVITEIERLLHRTIGEHVRLVTNLGTDLHAILADPGQMEQILVNLAVNARDAMPGGGSLTIETEQPRRQRGVRLDPAAGHAGPVRPSACQ